MKEIKDTYRYDRYHMPYQESRWAEPEEIMADTVRIQIEKTPYEAAGIPLLSDGRTAYVDHQDNHTLLLGATGSKKSRLFVMPMIHLMASAGESFVVTDPKGELYQQTAGTAQANGFRVVAVNFRDFLHSDRWNPLKLPYELYCDGKKDEAVGMLNDLINSICADSMRKTVDIYWILQASSLALALLLILFETGRPEEINMGSFVKLCGEYGKPIEENRLYELFDSINPDSVAGMNLEGVLISSEKTKDSIMSSLHAMVRIFILQKNLISMMADSDFRIQDISREKTAVYIMIPDEKNTFHFLATLFIKQCYETMIIEAQKQPAMGLLRRLNFVLDEFANIPAIPDMEAMITAARSRNIRFFLVIQSMYQLNKLYGENARTITSNCENWIYLNSKEFEHLTEISNLCGNVYTINGSVRPLISPSQLLHLSKKKGEALILAGRNYPILTQMADISEYKFPFCEAPALPVTDREETALFSLDHLIRQLRQGQRGPLFYSDSQKPKKAQKDLKTSGEEDLMEKSVNQMEKLIGILMNYEQNG
ncbi:type IV secretion system component VirD4 [uncultured Roseburia sp.]|uniref:Type IV secretory system conjugative DNA transfer family protein n=1 Tax=Brotonthovivens ammoniilytica TaxID=2981725 RepID=A0ABT2TM86_9FIRM|nr:type IV secretory system conjugative DNA transfer family protein [Brotonthovivens ammoniilytica]MCU6763342.1 type IV secretory system conjugative DNA transfer family protein [Brotonthovivens ammoniilytica]SCJ14188.1 type IV secretion system component VirD4 [uncultured Roseburia sp.]